MEDNFSAKDFYDNLAKGQLSIPRCKSCQSYVLPPTSICNNCLSTELEWVKIGQRGKIISFSEIFVSNKKFQDRTPYVVSIIETEEGARLPGIVRNATANQLKVGDPISIKIEPEKAGEAPGYYFALVS